MRELHLFAGAGGGILGGMLLGHTPVCAVEIEPFCQDYAEECVNPGPTEDGVEYLEIYGTLYGNRSIT